jgi:Fe-S oxidoreductase
VATTFDFSADGGLARAAELCSGVGECRKKRGGTMCPSYQATLEEQHSTRGRANTLRLALTGQADLTGLTDPAVLEALDLCLECKACKSECPTNVDMARLKAEVLDQHHRQHGLPWRSWLFGNVATLSAWGCAMAPVANWWAGSTVGRWLNEKAFAIDRRRVPPRFAKNPFGPKNDVADRNQQPGPSVLFFPDTFINYYEPETGIAALRLLSQVSAVFPYQKVWGCCGRPMISNGMLGAAIVKASQLVEWLYRWGGAIVACEPSCILTIKDDYPALLKGELRAKARAVAERCFTFEEFLEKRLAETDVAFRPGPKRILVQGHCHQRSLVGMGPTLKLLKRIPGVEVIDLDAGCCGMAGSFGYEKEHYDISRLVGEQRLFPAIRQADADNVIVAPGFSCRQQIEHFTGRKGVHPAALLHSLMILD